MVLMPDLHLEKFQLQEDGTWQKQRGGSEALKLREKKTGYQLMLPAETYPDGTVEERGYDEWENQIYQNTRYAYDANGNITWIQFPNGRITQWIYFICFPLLSYI